MHFDSSIVYLPFPAGEIAAIGHTPAHVPQPIHFSEFI
jgi:hypothetical protein